MPNIESHHEALVPNLEMVKQAEDMRASRSHDAQRQATLHRGTTFSYGSNTAHARMMRSLNAKRLQQLQRLRNAMNKGTMKAAANAQTRQANAARTNSGSHGTQHGEQQGGGQGGRRNGNQPKKPVEVKRTARPAHHADPRLALRRQAATTHAGSHVGGSGGHTGSGGGGGGQGGGGQNRQTRQDAAHEPAGALARSAAPPMAGRLGEVAQRVPSTGHAAQTPLAEAWCDDILDLLERLTARPEMVLDHHALALNAAWITAQKHHGAQSSGGIALLTQRAAARRTSRGASKLSGAPAGKPLQAGSDQANGTPPPEIARVADAAASPSASERQERVRDMHFLAPLMALNGDHPRPPAWRDAALARLDNLQAFAGARGAGIAIPASALARKSAPEDLHDTDDDLY